MSAQSLADLPWYETLLVILEPYQPATSEADADERFSSTEIIQSIEQHHGVPQGPIGKEIHIMVSWEDFVAVMRRLGYRETNSGGVQLQWLLKKKH